MGTNIINEITPELEKLNESILKQDYKNSNIIYTEIKKKLIKIKKEDKVEDISNYLLTYHTEPKYRLKFQTLLTNLKIEHKIYFLLELIYESKLVDSIDNIQININNNDNNILIKKKNEKVNKENNIEKTRKDIEIKMMKILNINNYIKFVGFKSIIFEKMAEKYFSLGTANYNLFNQKKDQSSNELQDIIDEFRECINNFKESVNNKGRKLKEYEDSLFKVEAHQNILKGKEEIGKDNFQEALKYFNLVNYNNSAIIDEKNKGIYICYEKQASIEEEKGNYEEAINYYKKINKYSKILELNIIINENKIIDCIKQKKYAETFEYFSEIFRYFDNVRNVDILEFKYSEISIMLIELIIKLSIISYQNNGFSDYIKTLENLKNKISYKDMESKVDSLIKELNDLSKTENISSFKFIETKLFEKENSEINQRFYLSFLIMKYLFSNPNETLTTILKPEIHLSYLNNESFSIIKNYFKEVTNLDNLFLISKVLYKIIVILNMFNNVDCLNFIGSKLIEINKIPNIKNDIKYHDIIEHLIQCFQEIMINNKKIKIYDGIKNILFSVFLKYNNIINCITRGLLFLSKKKISFDKKVLNILKDFLVKNKDGNLLQIILIQYQNQENISIEDIEIIYQLLLYYQEQNQVQKVEQIFKFLLEMKEEIIISRTSINNLENYFGEINIHPLAYELISKIPIKNRDIILSQKLIDYEDCKDQSKFIQLNNDNLKNELSFKVTIEKEELARIEDKLDDPEIVEKLIYFLKHQKNLYKYLNIEKISKFYSLENKQLFNLLLENEIKFNQPSLINILKGFYRNNEKEIIEVFNFFKKIKEYQNKFDEIIECNLKIEHYLLEKKYEAMNHFDISLLDIFNDFTYLFGFANQHQKFILYLLKMPDNREKELISLKMIEFLIERNYDIGTEIFREIIKIIDIEEIIKVSPKILVNKNIPISIKKLTLIKLYILIKKHHNKQLDILKSFKIFVDWIKIPNILLEHLLFILKNEKEGEIYNEIIFFLGNYFSIKKIKQEEYLNEINSIVKENQIYKYIIKNISTLKEKNEIFYLFSSLNYAKFCPDSLMEEELVIKMPTKIIVDYIKEHNKDLDSNLLMENITLLNDYWKFGAFSPKRDQTLRKLFFINESNALNNLKLICC